MLGTVVYHRTITVIIIGNLKYGRKMMRTRSNRGNKLRYAKMYLNIHVTVMILP